MIDQLLAYGPWSVRTLAVSFGVFALLAGTRFPRLLVFTSIGCYAVNMVNPDIMAVPGAVDLRLVGLVLAVYLAMLRRRLPRFRVLRGGIFPATIAYLVIGLLLIGTAQDTGKATEGLLGTLITMAYAWVFLCAADDDEIRTGIRWVAGVVVLGSIVWVVIDPGVAIYGDRWRGITSNANTLGLFSALYFLTGRGASGRLSFVAVAAVLLGSASRSAAFALGLVAGPKFLEGQSRRVRRAATVAALIVAIPILHAVFFSGSDAEGSGGSKTDQGLTRTRNSRIEEWTEAIDLIQANPMTGVGVGSQPDMVSSSIISPMAELGLPALIPLGLIVGVAISKFRGRLTWSRSIFVLLCVHGIFEMWLFAGGSLFFMVFLLVAYDPARRRRDPTDEGAVDEDDVELTASLAQRTR